MELSSRVARADGNATVREPLGDVADGEQVRRPERKIQQRFLSLSLSTPDKHTRTNTPNNPTFPFLFLDLQKI